MNSFNRGISVNSYHDPSLSVSTETKERSVWKKNQKNSASQQKPNRRSVWKTNQTNAVSQQKTK